MARPKKASVTSLIRNRNASVVHIATTQGQTVRFSLCGTALHHGHPVAPSDVTLTSAMQFCRRCIMVAYMDRTLMIKDLV